MTTATEPHPSACDGSLLPRMVHGVDGAPEVGDIVITWCGIPVLFEPRHCWTPRSRVPACKTCFPLED